MEQSIRAQQVLLAKEKSNWYHQTRHIKRHKTLARVAPISHSSWKAEGSLSYNSQQEIHSETPSQMVNKQRQVLKRHTILVLQRTQAQKLRQQKCTSMKGEDAKKKTRSSQTQDKMP